MPVTSGSAPQPIQACRVRLRRPAQQVTSSKPHVGYSFAPTCFLNLGTCNCRLGALKLHTRVKILTAKAAGGMFPGLEISATRGRHPMGQGSREQNHAGTRGFPCNWTPVSGNDRLGASRPADSARGVPRNIQRASGRAIGHSFLRLATPFLPPATARSSGLHLKIEGESVPPIFWRPSPV